MRNKQKQVMVRLSDKEVAALGVLTGGASREEWIRAQIRGAITRRLLINEMAVTQFRESLGQAKHYANDNLACGDAEGAAREREAAAGYESEIARYESEKAILYGAMEGV